jgi:hypothetical protein
VTRISNIANAGGAARMAGAICYLDHKTVATRAPWPPANKELISALRGKAIFQRIQLDVLIELGKKQRKLNEKVTRYLDGVR